MKKMLGFIRGTPSPAEQQDEGIFKAGDIPKEMDIFYRDITAFIPEGKTWDDLTDQEKDEIKLKYKFDPMRPGYYQGISGLGNMI